MSRNNNDKIVTQTTHKVIIKWERITEALTDSEAIVMNRLLEKIKKHDKEGVKVER